MLRIGRYQSYYRVSFAINGKVRQQHTLQASKEKVKAKPFSEIPEPKQLPLIGTLLDYTPLRNFNPELLYEHFRKRHREVGTIFKEALVPGLTDPVVYTNSAKDTETIFRNDERFTTTNNMVFFRMAREKLGLPGDLGSTKGEDWYQLRRVANEHLLKMSSVWSYANTHLEVANDFVDYIERNLDEQNEVPDFANALKKWSLEGSGVFVFDTRLGKLVFSPPLWKYIDTKDMKELRKAIVEQDEAIILQRERIGEKLKGLSKYETLIAKSGLSPLRGRMLAADIIAGGFETTANAAAFLLYCLATNPDKQEILRNEIKQMLNGGEEFTGKGLQSMLYMNACNREAQRLFPLTVGLLRYTQDEIVLSGYTIPSGVSVLVTSNICNNRDGKYYEDPDSFTPERWLTRRRENQFVMAGTFGQGPRMCPGRRFAMQELYSLMVALLSRYKVEYHHEPLGLGFRTVSAPLRKPQFTFVQLDH